MIRSRTAESPAQARGMQVMTAGAGCVLLLGKTSHVADKVFAPAWPQHALTLHSVQAQTDPRQ